MRYEKASSPRPRTTTTRNSSSYAFAYAPEIPSGVSAIAGDVLHNLRSTLDYAAFQAVWKSQRSPWDDSQFPIASSPTSFSRRDKQTLAKLNFGFVTVVKRNQPFEAVEDYRQEGLATDLEDIIHLRNANRPLAVLQDLSNWDKHRLLLARYARATDASFEPTRVKDCVPVLTQYQGEGALVAGARPIAVFAANPSGPHARPDMDVDFSFRPSVGLGGVGDAQEVLDVLALKVLRVVREFEPLF